MTRYITCIVLIAYMMVPFANAEGPKPLIISNSHSWAPMSFDNGGEPEGLLVDFWKLYESYNQREVTFRLVNWGESITAVKKGLADVHGGLLQSPERSRFLLFSEPIFPLVTGLFVRQDVLKKSDMLALRIGVISQSYEAEYMKKTYPQATLFYFDNNREMIESVQKGMPDAFVADFPTGIHFIRTLNAHSQLAFSKSLYSKPIHAAVALKEEALIEQIDRGILNIPKAEVKALVDKWQPITATKQSKGTSGWIWITLKFSLVLLLIYIVWMAYRQSKAS